MKKIIFSVTNDLVTDQRVHRIASTLMKNGAEVTLIGRKLPDSMPLQREYRTFRMNLIFNKSVLFYAEYNIRLFFHLLFMKADILVSNDLDTLPANFLVSVVRRKKLLYDSHEYFTGLPELVNRKLVRNIWLTLERLILPRIKYSYTVSQSIAEIYNAKYNINMTVVRNLPYRQLLQNSGQLPYSDFVLYQGSVNIGRGLEDLVEAFKFIPDLNLVIAGNGDIFNQLKEKIQNLGLENKIFLTGKLKFEELNKLTPHALLGFSIENNLGENYYYALPNKLFDYIQANVPVLVSDLPEMAAIVRKYKTGEVLKSFQPKELASQIISMVQRSKNKEWRDCLSKAAEELCWENEEQQLLMIYKNLL